MIYSIEEIKERIAPVAMKYDLMAVYLFGSYARNDANDESDIDILVDRSNSLIRNMLDMGGLYSDLCESVNKKVDLITTHTLLQNNVKERTPELIENIEKEKVVIYEKQ